MQQSLDLLRRKNSALAFRCQQELHGAGVRSVHVEMPDLPEEGVLCIYKGSLFHSLESLTYWVRGNLKRKVLFIEKEITGVIDFLNSQEAVSLLQEEGFEISLVDQWDDPQIVKAAWEHVFIELHWISSEEQEGVSFYNRLKEAFDTASLVCSEYRDYGLQVAANFYRNGDILQESRQGFQMKGIPAFICGAGPSMQELLADLSDLATRGLLMAGGSAFVFLPSHMGALVDPSPPYERFKECIHMETPVVYQMRASHEVLSLMHGEKIVMRGESLLEEALFNTPVIQSGWNVANFMATCAAEMGCDPIILLGMDMCYTQGKEYGVEVRGQETKGECRVMLEDGREVISRKDLLIGRSFFTSLIKRYPAQHFINATVGGLPIDGFIHEPLDRVLKRLPLHYDIKGLLHAEMMSSPKGLVGAADMESFKDKMRLSLEAIIGILQTLLEELEKTYLHQKANLSKNCLGARTALAESDLEDELAYKVLLEPLWRVWKWVFFRREETDSIEDKLRRVLFFQSVAQQHEALLGKTYTMRT